MAGAFRAVMDRCKIGTHDALPIYPLSQGHVLQNLHRAAVFVSRGLDGDIDQVQIWRDLAVRQWTGEDNVFLEFVRGDIFLQVAHSLTVAYKQHLGTPRGQAGPVEGFQQQFQAMPFSEPADETDYH